MGDDLSTGAKIGIGLVILCFLIAIVLSLLMVVKNITNSGANQMEGGLNQMMSTTYDDYDQKIITGSKVKAAMKLFSGEQIAIVIDTRYGGSTGSDPAGTHVFNYGLLLDEVCNSDVDGTATYLAGDTNGTTYGDIYKVQTVTETNKFNGDGVSIQATTRTGAAAFNLNTRPVDASGTETYVRDNAKYQSYLIKDSTNSIVGIYFQLTAS